jgi:glycosyltransferase involved in cell wall biosynthesis
MRLPVGNPEQLRKPKAAGSAPPGVLVVGQTPPPYHGQALMIETLVNADLDHLRIFHVRLALSESMQSVGRVEVRKALHLLGVAARAIRMRFRYGIQVLYYSPAGPNLVPVLRDLLLLSLLRPFFSRTIYHFHAAGLSDYLAAQPRWYRSLARAVYGRPDGAIQTSRLNPPDGKFFQARRVAVIPNGVEDTANSVGSSRKPGAQTGILFVGMLGETKGVLVLLEAARILARDHRNFSVWFMGQFTSVSLEEAARGYCREHGLEGVVSFPGECLDDAKWQYFLRADILCFPSFYESESFGNVAVEAMMFGLPVVATRWRGIPDVVDDGHTGLLVPIRDAAALADALKRLMDDPGLRRTLGRNGRRKYLDEYTIEKHIKRMEEFIHSVAETVQAG